MDPYTALAESLGTQSFYEIPFQKSLPLVMVAVEVKLKSVLDLTLRIVRRRLELSEALLTRFDWRKSQEKGREALTQTLGRLAWEHQWEGLIVPSARIKKRNNLVIFSKRLLPGSSMAILNKDKLPEPK